IGLLFRGLPDLQGKNVPALTLGGVLGKPAMGMNYDGTKDLDWWYTTDPTTIDANRNPLVGLAGSVVSGALSAGPGRLTITLDVGGDQPSPVALSRVRVRATVGAASRPLSAAMMAPPGHLPAEHLDPALQSFASLTDGEMCANVSAASLAHVPAPAD